VIHFELLRNQGILIVTPQGPLEKTDFELVAREVDPYIAAKGKLTGLMIYAKSFPGLKNFEALLSHLKFVGEHHRHIGRVAAVTDSELLTIMPSIVAHFVRAEVKHFGFDEKELALKWLDTEGVDAILDVPNSAIALLTVWPKGRRP
jgi:hypothetical protein